MNDSDNPPVTLSIAGSDSGGGAGIQADIKAMSHAGVHACTAITSLTAQNSRGVEGIHPVPPEFVSDQIEAIIDDFPLQATKTGMLYGSEIMQVVLRYADSLGTMVIDPVMVAASGDPLMEDDSEQVMVDQLLPKADLITPNVHETKIILKHSTETMISPEDEDSTLEALKAIYEYLDGPAVLLKGGHVEGEKSTDRLMTQDGSVHSFSSDRIQTDNTHGSGCVLSSLIAAFVAHGNSITDAVKKGKRELTDALRRSYACGQGMGTLNLLNQF